MPRSASTVFHLSPAPVCTNARLILFVIRRMAASGLNDAFAASALIGEFGMSFRRPLLLLRAMMAEMARASQNQIAVAPSCCGKTTPAEAEILTVVMSALGRPRFAHARLCNLMGIDHALGTLSSAQAVAQAFADLGRPLTLQLSSVLTEPAFPID